MTILETLQEILNKADEIRFYLPDETYVLLNQHKDGSCSWSINNDIRTLYHGTEKDLVLAYRKGMGYD